MDVYEGVAGISAYNMTTFAGSIYLTADTNDGDGYGTYSFQRGTDPAKDEDPSLIPKDFVEVEELTNYRPAPSGSTFTIK